MRDITHIERPNLPWRDERATECGLDATKHPTWTRDEAIAKARELGGQRFSLFACMTCSHTAQRHSTWEQDPASCLLRYCEKYTNRWSVDERDDSRRFGAELRALAMLAEAHPDEFTDAVRGIVETASLSDRRAKRDYKKATQ